MVKMKMIGCYATGIFPRPKNLIKATRAYERGETDDNELEAAFEKATAMVVRAQVEAGFSYVTDGMLRWQDPLRPFTENLNGAKAGSLTRWFNNNTFYRKPVITDEISRKKRIVDELSLAKFLPKNCSWKAILPAPYTFVQLSDNQYYPDKTEFMFKYAQILREEIRDLAKIGFTYVQLSDPSLVYEPFAAERSSDELDLVREALSVAVKNVPVKTCLQTFFGDFSQILPQALDFPVDHLGIDLYETNLENLKMYSFDKGVALGLVDARSSLSENIDELTKVARKIIETIYTFKTAEVFACPNCDLEFLPWQKAEEKMKIISKVARRLGEEFN